MERVSSVFALFAARLILRFACSSGIAVNNGEALCVRRRDFSWQLTRRRLLLRQIFMTRMSGRPVKRGIFCGLPAVKDFRVVPLSFEFLPEPC